jgi:hypothetical protein
MVHALREAWRILAASGILLDLRPISSNPTIEVVVQGESFQIGAIDNSAGVPDDAAAERAIRQVVEDGWFVLSNDSRFQTEHLWDSVEEVASFMETRRHKMHVHPPYADLEKIHRDLSAGAMSRARLRCRWGAVLAVYRKTILPPAADA